MNQGDGEGWRTGTVTAPGDVSPSGPSRVRDLLAWGRRYLGERNLENVDLEAQLLLSHSLGVGREELFTLSEDPPGRDAERVFRHALEERGRGVPAAYLLGRREFWSLDFFVDGRVLVPRPETEVLVEWAAEIIPPGSRVADIGTGCGNIVVALAQEIGASEWYAVDLSPGALEVARENLRSHGLEGEVTLLQGDLLSALAPDFDAVLSNPPYIATPDLQGLQPEVRLHEPLMALDGGLSGLDLLRRLLREAPDCLKGGGWLLVEVGAGQAGSVREMAMEDGRYDRVEVRRDLAGTERVVAARRS